MLQKEKTVTQIAAAYGIYPRQWHRWKHQALENFPQLFTESPVRQQQTQAHQQQLTDCTRKSANGPPRSSGSKKHRASTLTRGERLALLERGSDALPLTIQTHLLSLNRSSLYDRPVGPDAEEITLKHRIDDIDTDRPFYGSRRMTAQLNQSRG